MIAVKTFYSSIKYFGQKKKTQQYTEPQKTLIDGEMEAKFKLLSRPNCLAPNIKLHPVNIQVHLTLGNSTEITTSMVLHTNKTLQVCTLLLPFLLEKLWQHWYCRTHLVVLTTTIPTLVLHSNPSHHSYWQPHENHISAVITRAGGGSMGNNTTPFSHMSKLQSDSL